MTNILPTVRIKSGDSFAIINESDFDAETHELFVESETDGDEGSSEIEIPDDWKALHWKTRVALAEKLNGDAALTPAEGQTESAAADALIEAEIARRAAA